ncbi:MAG TPA: adenylate/guanylate cyclase domain-containing protein, partial [Desulfobacterales bacterium]|nr:adenylate/guanylate cyclase domain-containing protein [Desulfobacterales bacterium]
LSAVIAAVSVFLLLSIRRLQRAVGRMQGGAYETRVVLRRRDEIGDLGQSFNVMGESLQGSFRQITTIRDAYAHYVPREFLRLLGKGEVHEIELGNQVEVDMAVLFADIRSFTMLSEAMKPQENFNFLNSYLSRMGPIIRANHGFIDKYLGDGIMALFAGDRPGDPTSSGQDPARASADAVAAATAMQQELFTYNRQRRRMGYQPIQVGVGVHAGKVMLGILGEEERREGTVIADVVNLASRLEGLTKVYGARIIVSDQVIRMLGAGAPDHRYLGDAEVKGKRAEVPVHEVFAADPEEDVRRKRHTRGFFETGVGLFRQSERRHQAGFRVEALRYFRAVAKAHPGDQAAAYYLAACSRAVIPTAAPETPDAD